MNKELKRLIAGLALEEKEHLLHLLQEDIDAVLQTVSVSSSDVFFESDFEDSDDWDESSDVENVRVTTRLPDVLKSQFSPDIHMEFSTDSEEVQSLHESTEGPPVWDLVEKYIRRKKIIQIEKNDSVKVITG